MENAAFHFALKGRPAFCESYGCGHINRTFVLKTDAGRRYILQRINSTVFHDPVALMENISAVTAFLAGQAGEPREYLHLIPAEDGGAFWRDEDGEFWRAYDFVEDSICLQHPETPEDFYQSAVAFGRFQNMLADFPAASLHETIPNFHNTPDRYRAFRRAVEKDALGRAASVRREIDFALARENEAGELERLRESGKLPLRVTHNDTKLNNVMLDAETRRALCVIDLDTVMPGLAAYDFGDSIRFGAATADEDERDLDKMRFDEKLYEIYARGYISACPNLTREELESLPLGAKLMTLECGVRFLTDYLEGDVYFAIDRESHNLDRARTQFKLLADMERKWDGMCRVIDALSRT